MKITHIVVSTAIFTDPSLKGNRSFILHGVFDSEYKAVEEARRLGDASKTSAEFYVLKHIRTVEAKLAIKVDEIWQAPEVEDEVDPE